MIDLITEEHGSTVIRPKRRPRPRRRRRYHNYQCETVESSLLQNELCSTNKILLLTTTMIQTIFIFCTFNPIIMIDGYTTTTIRLSKIRSTQFRTTPEQFQRLIQKRYDDSISVIQFMSQKRSEKDDDRIKGKKSNADTSNIDQEQQQQQQSWNIGGFVPFFASQVPPPPESEDSNSSANGFWGNAGGWFRRDSGKDRETSNLSNKSSKRVESKIKPTNTKRNDADKSKTLVKDDTAPSPFAKIQEFFSFNSTSKDDRKNVKSRLGNNATNYNNSTNPLSVVQKFASSFIKFNSENQPEEKWYTVFPKTRIMPGESVPVTVAGIDLLVIASIDGRSLYCIANSCPHLGTPLETGKLTRLPIETRSISTPRPSSSSSSSLLLQQQQLTPLDSSLNNPTDMDDGIMFTETDITNILSQDGCEDCIICPLHRTAFALSSGEVRGEWCPYPPVIGAIMGTVKEPTSAAVFDVRTRGKNIEVRLNSVLKE